jgi:hypothetical protein
MDASEFGIDSIWRASWLEEVAMALLWLEGFEGGGPTYLDSYLGARYPYCMGGDTSSQYARQSGYHSPYGVYPSNAIITPFLTTDRILIFGFHFKPNNNNYDVAGLKQPITNDNVWGSIKINYYNNELRVYRYDVLLGATSTGGAFAIGRWHWIECKVYCDNVSGTVELRYGGRTSPVFTYAGDTQYDSDVNYHCAVCLRHGHYYDNLYVCDSTGASHNDFLGPLQITPMFPLGVGDQSQWTPNGGGDHYTYVDDGAVSDGDTTYLESDVGGNRELWHYPDQSALGSTIHGVQAITRARATDALCADVKTLAKSGGGSESEDTAQVAGIEYTELTRLMPVNPDGGAVWTQAALNGFQFGTRVG